MGKEADSPLGEILAERAGEYFPPPPKMPPPRKRGRPPGPKPRVANDIPAKEHRPRGRPHKERPLKELPPLSPEFSVHEDDPAAHGALIGRPPDLSEAEQQILAIQAKAERLEIPRERPRAELSLDTRDGVVSHVKAMITDSQAKPFEKLKALAQLSEMQGYNKALNLDSIRRMTNEQLLDVAEEVILALEAFGVRREVADA